MSKQRQCSKQGLIARLRMAPAESSIARTAMSASHHHQDFPALARSVILRQTNRYALSFRRTKLALLRAKSHNSCFQILPRPYHDYHEHHDEQYH